MQVVELSGSGYIWDPLGTYPNPGIIQQQIADAITANGWGLFAINVTTSASTYVSPFGYNYYNFNIKIINGDNSNPEIIRNAIQQIVRGALSGTQVSYVGSANYSTNPSTGQIDIGNAFNDTRPPIQDSSLLDYLIGKHDVNDVSDSALKIGGLSLATVALIAVGYLILTSKK